MKYSEFKKEAGIGDIASWAWDKSKDYASALMNPMQNLGVWSPVPLGDPTKLDSYRVFTPFAAKTTAFSDNKQPSASSIYKQDMTADQKFDAFQKDVRSQANRNISVSDALSIPKQELQNYGINLNPFSIRDNWDTFRKTLKTITGNKEPSQLSQLKEKALSSTDVKAAADRFLQSSDIGDIATYQKRIEAIANQLPTGEAAQQFKDYIADGMKTKVWDGIKADPLKNIPVAAGVFLRQAGLGKAGDFMQNPIAFYGSLLAAIVGGGLLLGGR